MLGFRWSAVDAGAPDDARYAEAADRLCGIDGAVLQRFPKAGSAFDAPAAPLHDYVAGWVSGRTPGRVVVMVHGFDFEVDRFDAEGEAVDPADDPFNRVYALPGRELAPVPPESWLPLVGEVRPDGSIADIAVAFGWDSASRFFGGQGCLDNGYQYAALDVAPLAARALATVIAALQDRGLVVDLLAHSLGTRVACQALRGLAGAGRARSLRRVVLLEGAEYSIDAFDAIGRFPEAEFFNIGNQDDDWPPRGAFASHPFRFNGTVERRVIAFDGIADMPNLVDLQIDRGDVRDWAAGQGYRLDPGPASAGSVTRGEHWAGYIHAENRRFITDILGRADRGLAWFRATGAPGGFARDGYGKLGEARIPPMPTRCSDRLRAIHVS